MSDITLSRQQIKERLKQIREEVFGQKPKVDNPMENKNDENILEVT